MLLLTVQIHKYLLLAPSYYHLPVNSLYTLTLTFQLAQLFCGKLNWEIHISYRQPKIPTHQKKKKGLFLRQIAPASFTVSKPRGKQMSRKSSVWHCNRKKYLWNYYLTGICPTNVCETHKKYYLSSNQRRFLKQVRHATLLYSFILVWWYYNFSSFLVSFF